MQNNIVEIQYLRAVAAMLVVVAHGGSQLPDLEWTYGGVAGVDVFFVVSGFIMAHTTRRFDCSAPTLRARRFMWRRMLRIVPLYWIALLWTIKVPLSHGRFSVDYAKDFLFIPRMHSTGNIWPELVAGWTLNYEMFFYAAFALAMLTCSMRYWMLTGLLAGLVAVGLALHPSRTFLVFYTEPIVLEFMFGVAVYYLVPKINASRLVAFFVLVAGFAVLLMNNGTVDRVIADGIPAATIVWAAVKLGGGVNEVRWLRFLGDASYSIYLFHLAALSVIGKAMRAGGPVAALPLPVAFAMVIVIPMCVGIAIHLFVERPLLRMILPSHSITHSPGSSHAPDSIRAPTTT
jgi:exopolysaccharide production protein ExoZ